MQQTQNHRAEQRLLRPVLAAHTRRGYSCYIYGMQTRGADRAGADARGGQVECRGVGGRSCLEFLLYGLVCASHQQLPAPPSGAGPGLEDARRCASVWKTSYRRVPKGYGVYVQYPG